MFHLSEEKYVKIHIFNMQEFTFNNSCVDLSKTEDADYSSGSDTVDFR